MGEEEQEEEAVPHLDAAASGCKGWCFPPWQGTAMTKLSEFVLGLAALPKATEWRAGSPAYKQPGKHFLPGYLCGPTGRCSPVNLISPRVLYPIFSQHDSI